MRILLIRRNNAIEQSFNFWLGLGLGMKKALPATIIPVEAVTRFWYWNFVS